MINDNNIKITTGDLELIYTGTVIEHNNAPIKITLIDKYEGDYTFIFKFEKDNKINKPIWRANVIDPHTLEIILINFENQVSIGNTETISVGSLRREPLFLNFRAFLYQSSNAILYNFYLKSK